MEDYGDILKKARDGKGYSPKKVFEIAGIPPEVVLAFEKMDGSSLPPRVYSRGFLIRYAEALDISEEISVPDFLDALFGKEKNEIAELPTIKKDFRPIYKTHVFVFFAAIAILSITAYYMYYQFRFFVTNPSVFITEPSSDFITGDRYIYVKGKTNDNSVLTLNGRPLYINEAGEFNERVNLANGLNALEFEAQNKAGKITKIIRYILVK